ncbi:MAG: hypothetical protein ACYTDW_00600 [Planctomycetota bacterium]|jgi:hypothetical protein
MKNRILLLALVLVSVMLAGCQRETVHYKCTTKITPGEEKDFYDVEFELTEIRTSAKGPSENRIAAPRLSCKLGETAKIMAADEEEQSGIFAEFFVPELDSGGTAKGFIHLKEKGQTKYLSDFQLTLPEKPSAAGS